jgi:predicted MFS family arabinose efflux permease
MLPSSKRWILFFFCCSSILISFNISALTAVIPAMARSLNVGPNDAASIIPFYMIPYGLCALFFASLSARFSIRSLMVVSCLLFALGSWICLWSDSLSIILTGRVVSGIGAAAVTPLALMTLGKIFKKEIRGRVMGLFFSSSFAGSVVGLLLSGFANWHWLYIVPAVLGVMLAIGFCFCPSNGMEANSLVKVNYLEAFKIGGLRRILLFIFFMSLLFHGVGKGYGVYLDKIYHLDQLTISLFIVMTAVSAAIGQMVGGFITDKVGRRSSCYIGICILGICVASLYGIYPLPFLLFFLCMISVGWTIAHNGISTVLTDFPDKYRLELSALNSSVRFLSGGVGFWVSGNFIQTNFGLTFLIIGCLMLVPLLFINKIVSQ